MHISRIDLTPSETRRLRIRYNFFAFVALLIGCWSGACAFTFSIVIWYIKFGAKAFTIWNLLMTLHSILFAFLTAYNFNLQFVVMHVTCFMFGIQLDRNRQSTTQLLAEKKFSFQKLKKVLIEYVEIVKGINKSSRFWSRFLGMAYFVFVTNFTFMIFDVFFAPIPLLVKLLWSGLAVAHAEIVSFIAYSGDIVSRRVRHNSIIFKKKCFFNRLTVLGCKTFRETVLDKLSKLAATS